MHPAPARRGKLLDWCDGLQTRLFKDRILPSDAAARVWGDIVTTAKGQRRPLEWHNSQIADTAAHLATRNIRHFTGLGLDLVDPFAAPT